MAVKPLPCKRDASLECEWPDCKCYPGSSRQSLSQEAVRDEVLEELRSYAESFSADDEGLHLAPENWNRMRELILALKREPNAALGMEHPNDAGAGPAPAAPDVTKVLFAAKNMDWMQVVLNGGPPCFHLQEDGRFCGRAERWDGHDGDPHNFVSFATLLAKLGQGWIPVSERLPDDETPVLILRSGDLDIGEIRWDMPGFEDTYKAFRYWDNPNNDGQAWEWSDITHWMPLPLPPGASDD